jgi:hypothetical protein
MMTNGACKKCNPKKFEQATRKTKVPQYFKKRRITTHHCPECYKDKSGLLSSRLWRMGDAEDEQWNAIHETTQDEYLLLGYKFFCNSCGGNFTKKQTIKIVTIETLQLME